MNAAVCSGRIICNLSKSQSLCSLIVSEQMEFYQQTAAIDWLLHKFIKWNLVELLIYIGCGVYRAVHNVIWKYLSIVALNVWFPLKPNYLACWSTGLLVHLLCSVNTVHYMHLDRKQYHLQLLMSNNLIFTNIHHSMTCLFTAASLWVCLGWNESGHWGYNHFN